MTTVQLYPEVLQHMTEVLQTPTVTTEVLQLLHHDHQVTAQAVAEDTAEAVQAEATAEEAAEALILSEPKDSSIVFTSHYLINILTFLLF